MSTNLKIGGSWETVTKLFAKIAGSWEQVQTAWIKVAGSWEQVYINFTASASDTTPSGADSGFSQTGPVTSNVITITPVGGTAPYTYAWAIVGGASSSGPFTATAPTGVATAFTNVCDTDDIDNNEQWRCTVTDDDGNETTVTVTVTLTWADLS